MSRSREEILKEIAKLKKELDDIPCEFCGKNKVYARGLCKNCYARLKNRGTCEYAPKKKRKEKLKRKPWREELFKETAGYEIQNLPYDFEETVDFFVSKLTDREKFVVERRANGSTFVSISKEIDRSMEMARQIYQKSLAKLRKYGFCEFAEIGLYEAKRIEKEKEMDILEKHKNEVQLLSSFDLLKFDISTRAYNCLLRNGIKNAGDLYEAFYNKKIRTFRNLGEKTEQELLKILFPLCIKYSISTEPLSRNH